MKYNFDEIIDRRGTNSLKWDIAGNELPMWVADMDFKTAPEIIDAIKLRAEHGVFGYSVVPDEWYRAYINWWKSRHNVEYKKDNLIFSTGVVPTISSCVRKLTTSGENVLLMPPVYNIFYNSIKNNGRNVQECPLVYANGEYSIDWELLGKCLADPQTTLMLLCNPHNPVGKIWGREDLARIGELAYANGVIVLSDEIHCDLTDPGCEYVPFMSVSEKCAENSVICISPTKAFNLAGLQTSAVAVRSAGLRHKVWRALNTDEVAEPNVFAVQAAVAAFEHGCDWLDELREYLYQNKRIVSEFLHTELPQIKLIPSQATYLLWLDCSELKKPAKELQKYLRETTGLYLSSGHIYGCGDRFMRINIACPEALVRDGLDRLKKAVDILREPDKR